MGQYRLLLVGFLFLFFRAYSHDCGELLCPEIPEQVNHCLDHSLMLPDGPYLSQRCGDSLDCIQQTFTYYHDDDALRILSDNPYDDASHYWINNVCHFYGKGFELNISLLYGWFFSTHAPAHFRFTGTITEEGSILKGDDAIKEEHRSYIEQWILEPENDFQKSCKDIKYFRSKDLLTANCREPHEYWRLPCYHQTGIPNISLYGDNDKNIIVNDNGMLKIRLDRKNDHETQALRHQKLEQGCVEKGMTVRHVGEYELCDTRRPLTVHNCSIVESAFDSEKDILFVRCYGSNRVYHLQAVSECISAGRHIYLEEEYSQWSLFSSGVKVWEGLSCRGHKFKVSDKTGL